jgi:hypothetical protein
LTVATLKNTLDNVASRKMEYIIGTILALVAVGLGATAGMDRDKAFYPTILIVVATYYVLFAAMDGTGRIIVTEAVAASAFVLFAVLGFRKKLWIVAAALIGHGVFDFVHHLIIENPGVPDFWPGFCGAFDVVAGAWLAARLMLFPQTPLKG